MRRTPEVGSKAERYNEAKKVDTEKTMTIQHWIYISFARTDGARPSRVTLLTFTSHLPFGLADNY